MKTNNMISKILKAVVLAAMTLGLANCSKSDGNSGSTTVNGYQLVNGICYQNVNGQLIQQSNTALCNGGTGNYQMINNICYQNVNGQLIQQSNTSLCTSNGTGTYQMINNICYQNVNGQLIQQANTSLCYNNGGVTGSQMNCNGQSFIYNGYMQVTCGVTHNCSGLQVNMGNGQIFTCM